MALHVLFLKLLSIKQKVVLLGVLRKSEVWFVSCNLACMLRGFFMQRVYRLLVVDDDRSVLASFRRFFAKDPWIVNLAEGAADALDVINTTGADFAIVDYKMPDVDGMLLIEMIKAVNPACRILMLTGHGGVRQAVLAIKVGATDFIEKPIPYSLIRDRIMSWIVEAEQDQCCSCTDKEREDFCGFVGESSAIKKIKNLISKIADSEASVIIQGESGTGKELVARALHRNSKRSQGKFIPIDCAALTEGLVTSELFGHVKGAFTGADSSSRGLFHAANNGTIFLDEVGELAPYLQAVFLRTLQEQIVRPVGSDQASKVNVRVISATNRDLSSEVRSRRFREDLYYRLNTFVVQVPPLRERLDDIPLLFEHFVKMIAGGKNVNPKMSLSSGAQNCLMNYSWPGNVRQFKNIIHRAIVLAQSSKITTDLLPPEIMVSAAAPSRERCAAGDSGSRMEDFEYVALCNALMQANGNRKETARILNIGEATVYRKLKKYGLNAGDAALQ